MAVRVESAIQVEERKSDPKSEKRDDTEEVEKQICQLYNSCAINRYIVRAFSVFTPEEVEDIVNDVFRYVLENSHKLRDKSKLKSWAYKIARSFAYIEKNRKRDKPLDFYGDDFTDLVDRTCYAADNVAEEAKKKEVQELVGEALEVLPPVCKKIMKLRYVDDLLLKEIAERLNLSYGNVRGVHARCIKLLRELLQESGVEMHDFYE